MNNSSSSSSSSVQEPAQEQTLSAEDREKLLKSGKIELIKDLLWVSKRRENGRFRCAHFGEISAKVVSIILQEGEESSEQYIRQVIQDEFTGLNDGLEGKTLIDLAKDEYIRIENGLWVRTHENGDSEVRVFDETADEFEKQQAAGTDEDWIQARIEANEEKLAVVSSILAVEEQRLVKERQIGPNDPCPCGAKRPDGKSMKFKKCDCKEYHD
jgi:hypothetical protein